MISYGRTTEDREQLAVSSFEASRGGLVRVQVGAF